MLLEYPGSQSRLRLLNKLFGSDLKSWNLRLGPVAQLG